MDHGPAGEDHSDGFIRRLAEGQVARVPDVPSHMEFHPTLRNLLFIADTGNNRIGLLDTLIGVEGAAITPNYDGANQRYFDNAVITTFIDGAAHGMIHPSGLAIHDGVIYVSDAATGTLYGFDLDDGALIDFLPTGMLPGSLCGITVDTSGGLWLADAINNRIYAIEPLPPRAEPEQ
jgi:DNA-binding beta-propeller fold protein YncE